jgi:dienelactone hydrolase
MTRTRVALPVCALGLLLGPLAACSNGGSGEGAEAGSETEVGSETVAGETEAGETETGTETGEPEPAAYDQPGPHPVGNLGFELGDPAGLRPLHVELWYPADGSARAAAERGQALTAFVPDEPEASTFAALVAAAPEACVRKQTRSAAGPELAGVDGPWPTLVFSHCHGCARFSSFSLAERLASHGFLVAAVDHAGSTLFDRLGEGLPPLDQATLMQRRDDLIRVIDELLDPAASSLPSEFVGLADGERLGVVGHSFGAVTTGIVLQDDPRAKAGVAIAAPLENPVLPGISMAAITEPLMLVLAVEDNSITEFGNNAIRTNFSMANPPVWKLEFADTGHFAYSDLAGLDEFFTAGCGEGLRQTDGEPFSYADPSAVRELAAGRVAAFFAGHLLADDDALAQLETSDPLLDIDVRE